MKPTCICFCLGIASFFALPLYSADNFTMDEANDQEECKKEHVIYRVPPPCKGSASVYKRSYVNGEFDEPEPTWPNKLESPLYEELSR